MICPYCGADEDRVIDSRAAEGGEAIRRRRTCGNCTKRFTTYERVEKARRLTVVKRDGTRIPFDGQKILAGIQAACGKRAIEESRKLAIIHDLEEELHQEFEREVPSREIGRRVATKLRELDEIVYLRFASEYYAFASVEEMNEEIRRLDRFVGPSADQPALFPDAPSSPNGARG
ncbi:MAG: transcriptional regulator NrdR [Phycisphaerales bacterium]